MRWPASRKITMQTIGHRALDAHVGQMLSALDDWAPDTERPADLQETTALLGPGVSWQHRVEGVEPIEAGG